VVDLNGSLTGVGLLSVVQLIGELHHTGTLHLTRAGASSSLAFSDGRLVAAECGRDRGLQAVALTALEFSDADFQFTEGPTPLEHTLDLSPTDLARLLTRIESGGFSLEGAHEDPTQAQPPVACALLGFADERDHHYSRSTAMHRCYAGAEPSLVSAEHQREVCLAGRFATCPRYRPAPTSAPAQQEPAVATGEQTQTRPPLLRAVPAALPAQRAIPPGVAARLAAASQMQISSGLAAAAVPTPDELGDPTASGAVVRMPPASVPPSAAPGPPQSAEPRPAEFAQTEPFYRHRDLVLIAAGVALGLTLLLLLGLVALPALRRGPTQPSVAPAAATESSADAPVSVAGARVTAVATESRAAVAGPTRVASSRAPAPTTQPRVFTPTTPLRAPATGAPDGGNALMDVRFASGPAPKWLSNPPYVSWGDGAYRLLAKDAMHFVAVGVPLDQALDDVIVSATFRKTGGPPGGGYGLIVRDQGPEPRDGENQALSAYVLETGDLGEYGVWRRDGDHWVDLVPWTRSSTVRSGGSPNELLVRAVGNQLTFSVNGSVIASVTDDTYARGGVGLFVGGDYNDVALDRFDLQRLD
jgi:hypothetical protein